MPRYFLLSVSNHSTDTLVMLHRRSSFRVDHGIEFLMNAKYVCSHSRLDGSLSKFILLFKILLRTFFPFLRSNFHVFSFSISSDFCLFTDILRSAGFPTWLMGHERWMLLDPSKSSRFMTLPHPVNSGAYSAGGPDILHSTDFVGPERGCWSSPYC